jgi:hypothetical protein
MLQALRETGKRSAGWLLSRTSGRYSYRNCLFILAHMRCGSTALSNVLCSRGDVSGYGETHVRHDGQGALGRLALNQMRREAWKPGADYLFDKILHCRHDRAAPAEFFQSRAIFMVRKPDDAIRSIVALFTQLGRRACDTPEKAAVYYAQRLDTLAQLWHRFPASRRIGITHETLLHDPDLALLRISRHLGFDPPLENCYTSLAASRRAGGGDPLTSGLHRRIEPALHHPTAAHRVETDLPPALSRRVQAAYERTIHLFGNQPSFG